MGPYKLDTYYFSSSTYLGNFCERYGNTPEFLNLYHSCESCRLNMFHLYAYNKLSYL